MKKLKQKVSAPHSQPFKRTCPCTILPPPFNFPDPPSRGNQNLPPPPPPPPTLKKGGPNYAVPIYLMLSLMKLQVSYNFISFLSLKIIIECSEEIFKKLLSQRFIQALTDLCLLVVKTQCWIEFWNSIL